MTKKNIVKVTYYNKYDINKGYMLKKIRELLSNLGEKKPIIAYKEKDKIITVYLEYDEKNLEYYISGNFKIYYYNKIEEYIIPDIVY